jgi:hypothetical protein
MLVLYIDGFGRFEGAVVQHASAGPADVFKFGLRFQLCHAKRQRVINMLALFVEGGLRAITNMKAARRLRSNGEIEINLVTEGMIRCELIDISLEGVTVRTNARPPLGQVVKIGETLAEITRHHESGIAMRFVQRLESA